MTIRGGDSMKTMTPLSPEQQRLAQSMLINVNRPIDDVLALLRGLSALDQELTARRKNASKILGVSIVIVFIGLILARKSFGGAHFAHYIVVALTVAAVIAAIASAVMYKRLKKADLTDDLTNSAIPFLTLLREDMNSGGTIHVKIDLRSAAINEKKVKENRPKDPRFTKIIESFFVNPWFSGNVVLADGTRLDWEVIDKLLQRVRTKRNPRGKYKTKTKEKWHVVGGVTVAFPTKQYAVADASADEKRHTIKLKRKVKTDSKGSSAFDVLVDMIAEAYGGVAVARRS
ncbi:MAG: hypothetical protein DMF59_10365 [Acidobacteria bacterium]|nr:MAG: hypothetical protein DMF59_10365 [Acidobacteriota bacterium]